MNIKKRMIRNAARLAAALLVLVTLTAGAGAEKIITLTFTGDCTLGSEEQKKAQEDSFISVSGNVFPG